MLPPKLMFVLLTITMSTSFQFGYHTAVMNQPLGLIADFIGNISETRYGVSDEAYKTTLSSICVTSFLIGGLLGAIFSGMLANKLGRKRSILVLTIPCLVGTIMIVICKAVASFELLIVGRLVVGFACGAYTAIGPGFLSEVTTRASRGVGGVLNQVVIVVAIILAQIFGLPSVMNTKELWPGLLGLNTIPCVIGAICMFFCPESPRYLLLMRNDTEGAAKALKFLRSPTDDIQGELREMSKEAESRTEKARVCDIWKKPHQRLALFVTLVAHCGQQFSAINGLLFYSVELFKSNGLSDAESNYATLGIGAVNMLITVVSIFVIDRTGRKKLLLGGLGTIVVCLITFTVIMVIKQATQTTWLVYLAIASIYIFVCGFGIGVGAIPWFIAAEMFPQESRDAASAIGATVNWSCVILIGLGFIQLIKYIDIYAFLPSACIEVLVIAFLWKFMPETMGQTVTSIESSFKKKLRKRSKMDNFDYESDEEKKGDEIKLDSAPGSPI